MLLQQTKLISLLNELPVNSANYSSHNINQGYFATKENRKAWQSILRKPCMRVTTALNNRTVISGNYPGNL